MKKVALASCLACGFAAALVLYFLDPARVRIYPVCPFHRLTGWDCPGCGGLRAVHALLHGDLAAALHFNLMVVLSLPVFAWLAVLCIRRGLRGEPMGTPRPVWLWCYLGAWVVFAIVRNLPFQAFAAFAP